MDFSRAMGTEIQSVEEAEHGGKPARAVRGSRFYATDIADLWDALTNAERIPRWFLPIDGQLELGGRYRLEGNAEGSITRCDPPDTLDVTWEFAGNVSWVSVRLMPDGDGTRLTLTHTMPKDEASEAHWATYGPGATGVGWDLSFFGLGLHLDAEGDVDQDAVMAWFGTDAGKDFIRGCAAAWRKAHRDSGEDAETAAGMAASTASFYTGE